MKILFTALLLIHGLIHLMGFAKAFGYAALPQLTRPISRPEGLLWLLAAGLLLLSALLLWISRTTWPLLALVSLILSQGLIVRHWQAARFGSVANLLVLLVAAPAFNQVRFDRMVQREADELLAGITPPALARPVAPEDLRILPPVVQRWLQRSGLEGKIPPAVVRLKQTGRLRTTPSGNWMPFTAEQYFDLNRPSFVWQADVRMLPMIHLSGRDKFRNGEGEMLIKLLASVDVVNEGHTVPMNTGTMLRFLGELCWFPAAALHPYLRWEAAGPNAARATLSYQGTEVSGLFTFTPEGDLRSFEALRYYGGGPDARQYPWRVEAMGYHTFHGYRIPHQNRVSWQLPEGEFTWLELEITALEPDVKERFTR